MEENIIDRINVEIVHGEETDEEFKCRIIVLLSKACLNFNKIFSYNVKMEDGTYSVHIGISQNEVNNTILVSDFINKVTEDIISNNKSKGYVSFGQPPLDMYLTLYDNMINSIVSGVYMHWPQLEYEDLKQTCYLVIVKLYNKGYFLHKKVIKKAFENDVYQTLRGEKKRVGTIRLEDLINMEESNRTYEDYLIDEKQDVMNAVIRPQELKELKDFIVEEYGEPFYNAAMYEYEHGCTSPYVRSRINNLKNKYKRRNV